MSNEVWNRINGELERRRLTWAWLARKIEATDQVVNNWSRRGVPPPRHAEIAGALGWSIDKLLGVGADTPAHGEAGVLLKPDVLIEQLGMLLRTLPEAHRVPFADNLAAFARERGADVYRGILLTLLADPERKHKTAA